MTRLLSVDALRGLTVAAMVLVNNPGTWRAVYPPLRHAAWHGWTLTDEITGPAIQITSTPDGKFCVGPPTVELAKCVQSSDKLHINRAFVREIMRDAVAAYGLTEAEVHGVAALEWADVVKTVDGARTCCGKTVIKVKLAPPD